jgi:Ricin-type beta-trefoil lectin domain-like
MDSSVPGGSNKNSGADQIQLDWAVPKPRRKMKTLLQFIQSHAFLAAMAISLAGINSASALSGRLAFTPLYPGNIDGSGIYGEGFIALDSAGNIIENSIYQHIVVKYDTNGKLLWQANINIFNSSGRVVVDSGNNSYASGVYTDGSTNFVFGVEKISPSGTILWNTNYLIGRGLGNEHGSGGPMAVGNNGSLYIACHAANFSQINSPLFILRVNMTNGVLQKSIAMGKTLDGTAPMLDSVLALDSANNVFYGGPEGTFSYSSDLNTVRWNNFTTSTTYLPYSVRAIICDPANNVYVTGTAPSFMGSGAYLMTTKRLNNANGNVVWSSTATFIPQNLGSFYPSGDPVLDAQFGGNALAFDSTGMLYAVGGAQDGSGYEGGEVVKYDPSSGTAQWSHELTDSDFGGVSANVAIDNNNNIHTVGILGTGAGAGQSTIAVFSTAGNLLWNTNTQFSANKDNELTQVALDNNSGVWVIDDLVSGAPSSPILAKYTESGGGSGTVPDGKYKIINRNSGLAMDVFGQHLTNGTPIDQWTYNSGYNQQWTVTSLGSGQYSIISDQSGRSLDVANWATWNGAPIDIWDHTGYGNQQFSFFPMSNGYYLIIPSYVTNSCIEGKTFATTNGTPVDLWQTNYGANQQWIFQAP